MYIGNIRFLLHKHSRLCREYYIMFLAKILYNFISSRDYFKQNNIDYKNLLRAAADEAGISYQKLSKAWEEGTELEVHKKIQLDKSGINIKTKYK